MIVLEKMSKFWQEEKTIQEDLTGIEMILEGPIEIETILGAHLGIEMILEDLIEIGMILGGLHKKGVGGIKEGGIQTLRRSHSKKIAT